MAVVLLFCLLTVAAVVVSSDRPSSRAPGGSEHAALKTFGQWLDEARVQATTKAEWAAVARDNAIVVLNSWDFRLIPILKRANPQVQVWVYKDLSGVRSDDCTVRGGGCGACVRGVADSVYLSSGIGYCWVKRNHPDWLLNAAATGSPFKFRNYPQTWETDYGNASYQRQWVQNVLADVRDHGWDGVEVDNALTTAAAYGVAAKYPTDAAVQAATYSALQKIGPALRNASVPEVFNVGYATAFPQLWQRWLGPTDGLEQEFYLSFSTRPNAVGVAWNVYEKEVSSCTTQHKSCWFHAGEYSERGHVPDPAVCVGFLPACHRRPAVPVCRRRDVKPSGAAPGAGWSSQRNVSGRGILAALFRGGCRGRKSLHVHVGGPA